MYTKIVMHFQSDEFLNGEFCAIANVLKCRERSWQIGFYVQEHSFNHLISNRICKYTAPYTRINVKEILYVYCILSFSR